MFTPGDLTNLGELMDKLLTDHPGLVCSFDGSQVIIEDYAGNSSSAVQATIEGFSAAETPTETDTRLSKSISTNQRTKLVETFKNLDSAERAELRTVLDVILA